MGLSNGDTAEVLFKLRALEKGLIPSTPYGLRRYDFIIDNGKTLLKIQVKMANAVQGNHFQFNLRPSGKKYTEDQVDVFAFYIAPLDTWYIVPRAHVHTTLMRIPEKTPNCYKAYEEAWYILSNSDSTSWTFSGNTKYDEPPALPISEPL